ncbi:MAG: hypothetical protein CFH43_01192, partial [Proteobacteria bacterium]
MTQQNKNVPDLRFPEFCGDWGDKVVKQLAQINPSNSKLPNEFTYIDLDSVNSGVLTKKSKIRLKDAPSRAQRLLQKGDVLYQMVRPYQKNNLTFNLDGDFVASTGFAQLRAKDSTGFLYQLINTDKFTRKVILRCTGTSYPAINSSDLSTISIQSPEKPEQQKIADFLSAVDERVDGLRRKKELLEQYKKGVMQKIFSQEIRFTQPDGTTYPDWKEKKLFELGDTYNGLTGKSGDDFGNGAKFITYKQVFDKSVIDISKCALVSVSSNEKQNIATYGDFFFTTSSEVAHEVGLSSVLLSNEKLYLNSFCFGFRPKSLNTFNPQFGQYLFRSKEFRKNVTKLAQGSTRYNISKAGFMKLA